MEIASSPGMPEPEEVRSFVVYDPDSGAVVHQHHTVRFPDTPQPSTEELEEHTIALARSQTGYEGPLAVLQVPHQALEQPGRHHVRHETNELLTEPHNPTISLNQARRPNIPR